MIDTIRFEVPSVSSRALGKIRSYLSTHQVIDNQTGEVVNEFCQGRLAGSWDSRIRIFVKDKKWVSQIEKVGVVYDTEGNVLVFRDVRHAPVQVLCRPFLVIEFSLPKWAHGVNVLNLDFDDDIFLIKAFSLWLQALTGARLPHVSTWFVTRLDLAHNFYVGESLDRYLNYFGGVDYPRRKTSIYNGSVMWSGAVTTVKVYDKYKEFRRHDRGRVKGIIADIDILEEYINGLLRIEVELKNRFIQRRFDGLQVKDLKLLEKYYDKELLKVFKGIKMSKVNTYEQVCNVIRHADLKGKKVSASKLIDVWVALSTKGSNFAKDQVGKRSYYYAIRVFRELGISVLGSDLRVEENCKVVDLDVFRRKKTQRDKELNQILSKNFNQILNVINNDLRR